MQQELLSSIAEYEAAIAENPGDRQLYWHYGLALLLDGQEAEAQSTWMMVLAESGDQVMLWQAELEQILQQATITQTQLDNHQNAWLIRQYLRELNPTDLENLLHLLILSTEIQALDLDSLQALSIIEVLQDNSEKHPDQTLLLCALERYLNQALIHPITVNLVAAIVPHVQDAQTFVNLLLPHIHRIGYAQRYTALALQLVEINLAILPQDFESLMTHAALSEKQGDYAKSLISAQTALTIAQNPGTQNSSPQNLMRNIAASRAMLQTYLSSGQQNDWFGQLANQLRQSLNALLQQPICLNREESYRLLLATMYLPYVEDAPDRNRALQNQIIALCEKSFQQQHQEIYDRYQAAHQQRQHLASNRPLKVGYVCQYFYQHSVGWLARWLLKKHNPQAVELYIYIVNPRSQPDYVQQQYLQMSLYVRCCPLDALQVAEQVHQDELDILVELDSLTCQMTCELMALKPAPIQVSWLGWDAVGMAAIDYYLADHYVLPENAQEYYIEKIVRLPQAYISVDGFEIGVPNISRQLLEIPDNAIVFLSAQRGYKRNPNMIRMQLEILRQVPNSYLLIKGIADETVIQKMFSELAAEVGVAPEQLRFLPIVASEEIHRANIAIADVILDTYPYNGATTTLEALWMERPLVTQVGQQFAARNSYTMLKNAGIEAGIAFSPAEYVEWGVRLGTDEALRQQVVAQLKQAKRSAPLWNSKQFAEQVEAAYRQIWQDYCAKL